MALLYCYFLSFSLFLFVSMVTPHEHSLVYNQDLFPLLSFKASADPHGILRTWVGLNPCCGSWIGVKCYRSRVVAIYLDNSSLVGSISPLLVGLGRLRVLSLRRNALNGFIPLLTNRTNTNLRHLLLSHNQFGGTLHITLPSLLSFRAEHNDFFGGLEGLQLPNVKDLNVSNNNLVGDISFSLSKFPRSSFEGNLALCGSPLSSCINSLRLSNVSINTSPSPNISSTTSASPSYSRSLTKFAITALLAISISDILVVSITLAIVIGLYIWLRKKLLMPPNSTSNLQILELDSEYINKEKEKDGGLVCFEGGEDLKLETLLKASAEVLGKGVSGSTYKAILGDGIIVAAKRLSTVQFPSYSKNFDRHLHIIGRLRHSNVVSLRAYCSANEERLLVYDYMPNGSLQSLLRSTSNEGRLQCRSLDWRRRKQILFDAANGLNYIHSFLVRPPLVHANIKPSNILIDEHGNACIAECSLMRFAVGNNNQYFVPKSFPPNPFYEACSAWHAYRPAPELSSGRGNATQESDVYSFGMVLLEVVRDHKDVEEGGDDEGCEGEVMGMVKVGMLCTAERPEERPKMSHVVRMISEFL